MDGVWAWVEDQREQNRSAFFRFLDEQRAIWTPRNVFHRCCVKWLADGAHVWHEYQDEHSFRNGCDGRCGREHPRIVLDYDAERKTTTATLTHPELAPFQRYFSKRVNEESAWVRDRSSYDLNGYLRENQTKLREQSYFGNHLVSVASGALEASDAAFQAEQEEESRPTKRLKNSNEPFPDLERVMDIALAQRLGQDLDPVSLYCMRQTSRLFRRIATRIATDRLKSAKFTIVPLVDGMERFGMDKIDGYDSDSWEITGDPALEDGGLCRYCKRDTVVLEPHVGDNEEETLGQGSFQPVDTEKAQFVWRSEALYEDVDQDSEYEASLDNYSGQLLRVYWQPQAADNVEERLRLDVHSNQPRPPRGLLIGRFYLNGAPDTGLTLRSRNGVVVQLDVLESAETRERADEYEDRGDDGDSESVRYTTSFSGRARVVELKVDYGVLVRQHAIQMSRKLKAKHRQIERERPLRRTEVALLQVVKDAAKPL